jgi:hypothetical protein
MKWERPGGKIRVRKMMRRMMRMMMRRMMRRMMLFGVVWREVVILVWGVWRVWRVWGTTRQIPIPGMGMWGW